MELSLAEIVTPNTLLHFPESQFLTLQNVKKNDYLMGLKKKIKSNTGCERPWRQQVLGSVGSPSPAEGTGPPATFPPQQLHQRHFPAPSGLRGRGPGTRAPGRLTAGLVRAGVGRMRSEGARWLGASTIPGRREEKRTRASRGGGLQAPGGEGGAGAGRALGVGVQRHRGAVAPDGTPTTSSSSTFSGVPGHATHVRPLATSLRLVLSASVLGRPRPPRDALHWAPPAGPGPRTGGRAASPRCREDYHPDFGVPPAHKCLDIQIVQHIPRISCFEI